MVNLPRRTFLAASISLFITGCGGGGGGGGGNPILRPDVPFYTPVRIDSVKPIAANTFYYDQTSFYSANLTTTTGPQDLVMAGSIAANSTHHDYDMQIWSWSNGQLVNKTSQWFSGTDNRIRGSVPSVNFADFDGDGRQDMYVAPYVESNVATQGPGVVFFNNGTNFTRLNIDLENANGHHSIAYDINRDGLADIFTTGSRVSFAQANRTFTTHWVTSSDPFGNDYGGTAGAVAVADFMGNGTSTVILTDQPGGNKLYSWNMVDGGRATLDFQITKISDLPASRFLLPKWSSYGFTGSHDIRVLAFDFDNSGRTSAVVFSRPWQNAAGQWPDFSEVQFNKNMGGGVFVDVTDQVLVGYDHTKPAPYNPTLMDVNSDGLIDIVMNGTSWTDNSGAQVLIHTKEHKYVASYATVLKAFADQAYDIERAINRSVMYGANGIVFVQGPDNQMYLATAVTYDDGGVQKKAIYLSKLGTNSASAQATADAIKQQWPWMSPAQVNAVLAQSSTTWFGLQVLDPVKAMSPVGELRMPLPQGMAPISGHVSGLRLSNAANNLVVQDSIGRDFRVDYSITSQVMTNAWARAAEYMQDSDTRSAQFAFGSVNRYQNFLFTQSNDNLTAVLGITGIDVGRGVKMSLQYTRLPFNPFVSISGSWGEVVSSGTMETTFAYRQNHVVAKTGVMYTGTEIRPGLVSKINPITSVWGEIGYEPGPLRVYAGLLPRVLWGSADVNLPTGIDQNGRVMFTNRRIDVEGVSVGYARMSWNDRISRQWSYQTTAIVTTQNQYNLTTQLKYAF